MKRKGNEINWFDVDQASKPGEYDFRGGKIQIRRKHLDFWKKDPTATLILVRFLPTVGTRQAYGLSWA
jgi:hypothetical protein